MAAIYPLAFPSGGIATVEFTVRDKVGDFSSEFSGNQSVVAHLGQRLDILVSSVALRRAEASEWIAFMNALRGKFGTFSFGDPFNIAPRGSAPGTPLIDGASETGEDINSKGWTPSQSNIIRKADWLQFGTGDTRQLTQSLTDVNSDASGLALLSVYPHIRTAFADSTAITTASPTAVFRLLSNERGWEVQPNGLYKFAFSAREAF